MHRHVVHCVAFCKHLFIYDPFTPCVTWKPQRWIYSVVQFSNLRFTSSSNQKHLLHERWRHRWSQYNKQMVQEISLGLQDSSSKVRWAWNCGFWDHAPRHKDNSSKYVVPSISFQTVFEQAFKIVVDSWKYSMLLLYILWDDWPIFMISGSNEQQQQELEYTLLKSDCHS